MLMRFFLFNMTKKDRAPAKDWNICCYRRLNKNLIFEQSNTASGSLLVTFDWLFQVLSLTIFFSRLMKSPSGHILWLCKWRHKNWRGTSQPRSCDCLCLYLHFTALYLFCFALPSTLKPARTRRFLVKDRSWETDRIDFIRFDGGKFTALQFRIHRRKHGTERPRIALLYGWVFVLNLVVSFSYHYVLAWVFLFRRLKEDYTTWAVK